MMDFSSGWGTSTSGEEKGGRECCAAPPKGDPRPAHGAAHPGTFRVQEPRHTQVVFSHREGLLQVLHIALVVDLVHVNQHWPAEGRGGGCGQRAELLLGPNSAPDLPLEATWLRLCQSMRSSNPDQWVLSLPWHQPLCPLWVFQRSHRCGLEQGHSGP